MLLATLAKRKEMPMYLLKIITLLGGLALFLYGMQMMSSGLEAAAGDKMKSILEKLTAKSYWPYPTYSDLLFY